jgi:hypothetical protein
MLTAIPDTTSSFSASDGCSEMSETRPKGALLPFFAMPFAMRLPECPAPRSLGAPVSSLYGLSPRHRGKYFRLVLDHAGLLLRV